MATHKKANKTKQNNTKQTQKQHRDNHGNYMGNIAQQQAQHEAQIHVAQQMVDSISRRLTQAQSQFSQKQSNLLYNPNTDERSMPPHHNINDNEELIENFKNIQNELSVLGDKTENALEKQHRGIDKISNEIQTIKSVLTELRVVCTYFV